MEIQPDTDVTSQICSGVFNTIQARMCRLGDALRETDQRTLP